MTDSLEARQAELKTIAQEVAACEKCPLYRGRTRTVPGDGPADTQIMFIGEAPGFHEDQQGLPFVGASGKYLTELLASVGLSRKDVFITNVVKCRPPQNRDPQEAELAACEDYLNRQIEAIQPKIIITLGRFSMAKYFPGGRITRIHGQPKRMGGRIYYPMFHPAAVLRNPKLRPEMEADMKRVLDLIKEAEDAIHEDDEPDDSPPVQLSLF
jgi:uracil-DNA glycosylase family 4